MGKAMDLLVAIIGSIVAAVFGALLFCGMIVLSCAPFIVAGVVIVWIVKALGWV